MTDQRTDDAIRDALQALASQVEASPGAYHEIRSEWIRRQRRRRRLGVLIAVVVIAVADLVGLWVLSDHEPVSPVFGPSVSAPTDPPALTGFGQP